MGAFSKSISLSRESSEGGCLVRFLEESTDAWYVVSHKNTSLGFKYDIINKRIVACNENEQVYHSYLPTYDKVLFPVKINADFTTDPSRKHITVDSKTEMALADIAENILHIVNSVFEDNNDVDFGEFFSILCSNCAFGVLPYRQTIYLALIFYLLFLLPFLYNQTHCVSRALLFEDLLYRI